MKQYLIPLFLSLSAFLWSDPLEVRRFGLFVGANDGGMERQTLVYADDDARTMARTMRDLGGIDPADMTILTDPDSTMLFTTLDDLSHRIDEAGTLVRRTEILFYYSGHSDESGILLKSEEITYREIRDRLDLIDADVVIAILDSCASGAFTRTKGGAHKSPFLIDDSASMEGHVYLTSSSDTELSQESDSIGASFFAHFLVTGLRGAADHTGDGRVSLNELYQYTFQETLSRTESTLAGPQHPSYEIQLTGTGDLILTDLTIPTSSLQLSADLNGRFYVRDDWNQLVAEFSKRKGETLKLALPAGYYSITAPISQGNNPLVLSSDFYLGSGELIFLSSRDFEERDMESNRTRGNSEPETEKVEKYLFTLIPGVDFPELNPDDTVRFQGSVTGSTNVHLKGLQLSILFSLTRDNSIGAQISGLFNTSGHYLNGFQLSGLFNTTGNDSTGVQIAGLFNTSKEFNGLQLAGLFNHTNYLNGVQAGLVNIGNTVSGVQIGLVNISKDLRGVPIGLINIVRNGISDLSFWYEYSDGNRFFTGYQSGNRNFYTLIYSGFRFENIFEDPSSLSYGIHLGGRIYLGPLLLDIDGGFKQARADSKDPSVLFSSNSTFIPSFRALLSLKRLGILWGVTVDIQTPGQDSDFFKGSSFDLSSSGEWKGYYKFFAGIRF